MDIPIDTQKTLEVIERMKLAKIGKYDKWEKIIKKIKNEQSLSPGELEYYTNLTRIYKDSSITSKSKIYHSKLSSKMKSHHAKNVVRVLYTIAT